MNQPTERIAPPGFPAQPAEVPWPTRVWAEAPPGNGVDRAALAAAFDHAFQATDEVGETRALLAVHRGVIVAERYGAGVTPESTLPSWSMAKSVLQAAVGHLVSDRKLDLAAPAPVPRWQVADDPRRAITLDHLLRMSDGLAFREEYVDGDASDVIPMLFGSGKDDVAAFAERFPLAHTPGSFWSYSSGTSNIVSGIVARMLGGEAAYRAFLGEAIFGPLGMASAEPRFDAAGTWIASSFVFATARDFARFGLLYLRGGAWDGGQLLPRAWCEYARTPAPACATGEYGAHWWIYAQRPDVFYASGYEGQRIVVSPAQDLVLVRLGKSAIEQRPGITALIWRLLDVFPRSQSTS